jgi:hypothetical protein
MSHFFVCNVRSLGSALSFHAVTEEQRPLSAFGRTNVLTGAGRICLGLEPNNPQACSSHIYCSEARNDREREIDIFLMKNGTS